MADAIITGVFALLGAAVGLVGERLVRSKGALLFRSSGWYLSCAFKNVDSEGTHYVPFDRSIPTRERLMERADHATYDCDIKMFNEKEIDTGLRDVAVVFVDNSGTELIRSVPQTVDSRNFVVDPDVINLPARQWVYGQYHDVIQPDEFEALARSTKVELRAFLPGDKPFVREIRKLWE